MSEKINLAANILNANDLQAMQNRNIFIKHKLMVINLMSSPGSGKTTLLERTIETLHDSIRIGVIEGDLYTDFDAQRIEKKGVIVKQINTIGACHLDAQMIKESLPELDIAELDLVFIENVGNLVCPAEFNLGEDFKAVVLSTTEGNDKVLKYPLIFREARVVILNKIDLMPYVDFSLDRFRADLARINADAPVFVVSGKDGTGIAEWCDWLIKEVNFKKANSIN